jgi:hypothetical protein
MGIIDLLLGTVFATSLTFGIGLGAMSGASTIEVWVARACFSVAALVVLVAFLVWFFQEHRSWVSIAILGSIAGSWICVGLPLQLQWLDYRQSQKPIPEALLASQIEEMKSVGALLNGHICAGYSIIRKCYLTISG